MMHELIGLDLTDIFSSCFMVYLASTKKNDVHQPETLGTVVEALL